MTEKIGSKERPEAPRTARYAIDPTAFFLALVGAPFLIALLTFWALFVPVFAVVFGGPVYLVVGTPILLIYLHYRQGDAMEIAGLAFLANLGLMGLILIVDLMQGGRSSVGDLFGMAAFGLVMGPLWGIGFAGLYNKLRGDASRAPIPTFAHL